jgi:hypothetical protein
MPKFMLLLRADATEDYSDYSPDDFQKLIEDYQAWSGRLAEKGLLHDGKKLTDGDGRVLVPAKNGSVTVKDGPYVETKEVVGGFYLLSADSYDHAVELCAGHPNFKFGSIEIRQVDCLGGPEE